MALFFQTYADYTSKKRAAVLKRIKKKYKIKNPEKMDPDEELPDSGHPDESTFGILLDDYIQIFAVLIHIDDVDKVGTY